MAQDFEESEEFDTLDPEIEEEAAQPNIQLTREGPDEPDQGRCFARKHLTGESIVGECCRTCEYCSRKLRLECFFEHRAECDLARRRANEKKERQEERAARTNGTPDRSKKGQISSLTEHKKSAKRR